MGYVLSVRRNRFRDFWLMEKAGKDTSGTIVLVLFQIRRKIGSLGHRLLQWMERYLFFGKISFSAITQKGHDMDNVCVLFYCHGGALF